MFQDTLRNAPEITGGIGAHLLRKMGWEPGLGLGRNMDGPVEPLVLDVKSDRKGLFSVVDKRPSRREKPAELNGRFSYCACGQDHDFTHVCSKRLRESYQKCNRVF